MGEWQEYAQPGESREAGSNAGDLPEEFVAFLFGRLVGSGSLPIEDRIDGMSCHQLAGLMRRVADRLGQES